MVDNIRAKRYRKAMILAAGNGTRLKPLTDSIPKPMVPINGKPIMEYTIDWLGQHGISEIAINLHYRSQVIVNHFGNGEKMHASITYSYEEELLGTAGAVKKLSWFFDEPFLVIYGDNLTNCNLDNLLDLHDRKGGIGTVALFERDDTSASGVAELNGDNRIVRFVEKPKKGETSSKLVNAGIYVLEPEVMEFIPDDGFYDFGRQLFPQLLSENRRLNGYVMSEHEKLYWADTIESYTAMCEAIETGQIGEYVKTA